MGNKIDFEALSALIDVVGKWGQERAVTFRDPYKSMG